MKGPIEYAEWQAILNQMNAQIQSIENTPKSPQRDSNLSFFSEGAAQFRFFKNGWRMKTAHGRGEFNEPQALEAIEHVRSFLEIISKRLKE